MIEAYEVYNLGFNIQAASTYTHSRTVGYDITDRPIDRPRDERQL